VKRRDPSVILGHMNRYYSAREIQFAYKVPLSTIYRHACRDRWRRTPAWRRPILYSAADVMATFDRLAAKLDT
jgi:hypothetical protein